MPIPADEKRGWGTLKWLLVAETLILAAFLSFSGLAPFLEPISWIFMVGFYAGVLVGLVSFLLALMASETKGGSLAIGFGMAFAIVDSLTWFVAVVMSSGPTRH